MESQKHKERMARFCAAGLYLVTSECMSGGRSTLEVVSRALAGGVRLIQLREKDMQDEPFLELAKKVRRLTEDVGAILIVNDRIDVAERCGADGVHLGLDDMPIQEARQIAPDLIIGASSHNVGEAVSAQDAGASYVNIGPIYSTKTKQWDDAYLGVDAIREIAPHINIPWTVMGGIKKKHLPGLIEAGAMTIAVVTAITMAEDIAAESAEMLRIMRELSGK